MYAGHTPLLSNAIDYATRMHYGQKRKNKREVDYVTHPLEVMQFLKDHGITDESVLACAVLHDVVEHTPATYESLLHLFGKDVTDMVMELTYDRTLPKLERKLLQVNGIGLKSVGARLVMIGDILSNTRELLEDTPDDWTADQAKGYIMWSEHVCRNACKPNDIDLKIRWAIVDHFDNLGAYGTDAFDAALNAYYDSIRECT
jgi:hypothetical protein